MIEVAVDDVAGAWDDGTDWEKCCTRAITAAIVQTPYAAMVPARCVVEISVRLTSDDEVRSLNRDYRGKDKPTNVLSFASMDGTDIDAIDLDSAVELLLGDIVLARETCQREAESKGISFVAHATHLVVHGTLHLLGYDHGDDDAASQMEGLESAIMASLGHDDPYALPQDGPL